MMTESGTVPVGVVVRAPAVRRLRSTGPDFVDLELHWEEETDISIRNAILIIVEIDKVMKQ
jgi:hypothetical protein